eukprot:GHVH01014878.1.p1 GENE.GHVH01014878.1~~GHVH01014878.1.p1  ORF type:complete len:1118 (+),score=134.19 GHVH01014878.1:173-3526(+)
MPGALEDAKHRAVIFNKKQYDITKDKSLKGSFDDLLVPLLTLINEKTDGLISTSCCSGRISVHADSRTDSKSGGRLLYVSHGWVTSFKPTESPAWNFMECDDQLPWPSPAGDSVVAIASDVIEALTTGKSAYERQEEKKSSGGGGIEVAAAENRSIATLPSSEWADQFSEVVLRFEPFVIHVEARSSELLKQLVDAANLAGLKNSGAMGVGPKRYIMAFRGTARFDIPLYHDDFGQSVEWHCDSIQRWVSMVRSKFMLNVKQIRSLESAIISCFHSPRVLLPPRPIRHSKPFDFKRFGVAIVSPIKNTLVMVGGTGRVPETPEGRLHQPVVLVEGVEARVDQLVWHDGSWSNDPLLLPAPRVYPSACSIGFKGLAFYSGGRASPDCPYTDAWFLWISIQKRNEQTGSSPMKCIIRWYRLACMLPGRYRHSTVTLLTDDQTIVHIDGGRGEVDNSCHVILPPLRELPASEKDFVNSIASVVVSTVAFISPTPLRHSHHVVSLGTKPLLLGGMVGEKLAADFHDSYCSVAPANTYYPSLQPASTPYPYPRASAGISAPLSVFRMTAWLKASLKKLKIKNDDIPTRMMTLGGVVYFYGGGFGNSDAGHSTSDYRMLKDIWVLHIFETKTNVDHLGTWSYLGEAPDGDELDHVPEGASAHLIPQTSMLRGCLGVVADGVLGIYGGGGNAFMAKTFYARTHFLEIFPSSDEGPKPVEVPSREVHLDPTVPTRYVRLGHIALIPREYEKLLSADDDSNTLIWKMWAEKLSVSAIGFDAERIIGDYRQRRASIMYCTAPTFDPWVIVKEGGTVFKFHFSNNMFCKGNYIAKDRLRTLPYHHALPGLTAEGEVILDLFVGIGYFAAPILTYQNLYYNQIKRLQGDSNNRIKSTQDPPKERGVRGYSKKREKREKALEKKAASNEIPPPLGRISKLYCNDWNFDALLAFGHTLAANFPRDTVAPISAGSTEANASVTVGGAEDPHSIEVRCTLRDSASVGEGRDERARVADRVLLGLIPDSRLAWMSALRCLKPEGGLLHVHDNSDKTLEGSHGNLSSFISTSECTGPVLASAVRCCVELESMIDQCGRSDGLRSIQLLNVQKVKNYAPRIYHFIYDILITWHCHV